MLVLFFSFVFEIAIKRNQMYDFHAGVLAVKQAETIPVYLIWIMPA